MVNEYTYKAVSRELIARFCYKSNKYIPNKYYIRFKPSNVVRYYSFKRKFNVHNMTSGVVLEVLCSKYNCRHLFEFNRVGSRYWVAHNTEIKP